MSTVKISLPVVVPDIRPLSEKVLDYLAPVAVHGDPGAGVRPHVGVLRELVVELIFNTDEWIQHDGLKVTDNSRRYFFPVKSKHTQLLICPILSEHFSG